MKTYQCQSWEHPNIADWEDFARRTAMLCELHRDAPALSAQGVRVASFDEKTGIQAIERAGKPLPMKPGSSERQECNYIRHGTQCLMSTIDLGTGRILEPTIQDTRTEADFVEQIDRLIRTDPDATWILTMDQLNTHKSESIVKYIAQAIGDTQDLGAKGRRGRGILKDMPSRMAYLEDPSHRIRFVYTPKHCSWLNTIEVWFSILTAHRLRRSNFTSIEDLKEKIERYIAYYNEHLAKPWNWSVVKNKDIQALIDKVKRIEGAAA